MGHKWPASRPLCIRAVKSRTLDILILTPFKFSEKLNISKMACHKILHEDLGKRKLKAGLTLHSVTHCQQDEDCSTICADLV
jgi:hypothetical protein